MADEPSPPLVTGPEPLVRAVFYTWRHGSRWQKALTLFAMACLVGGLVYLGLSTAAIIPWASTVPVWLLIGTGLVILTALAAYWQSIEAEKRAGNVRALETQVRENPKETKLAWDLARIKLESYLDRNLRQVSGIFFLILLVMFFGMALVGVGVWEAIRNPQAVTPSLIAALAGIIVQFIGGTFLIIYRSTMDQAKNYVVVLERINAVGMSINILASIESGGEQIRDAARASLARDLLGMYGPRVAGQPPAEPRARSRRRSPDPVDGD